MIICKNEIIELALKGIKLDMNELTKSINIGKKMLEEINQGKNPKTCLSKDEIEEKVYYLRAELNKKIDFYDELKSSSEWEGINII